MAPQNEHCLRMISEITQVLRSAPQAERVFHLVVYRLARLYSCQTTAIILIDPKTEYLHVANSYGISQGFCNQFRQRLATGIVGELFWRGTPVVISDSILESSRAEELTLEHPFRSCVAVQISIDQRTVGYLHADSTEPGAFTDDDLPTFQICADLTGVAWAKAQLREEVLRLERIDKETGTEKYAPFVEKLRGALERARNFHEPFNIVLLDVDNFKTLTNTYGHDVTTELLRQLAEIARTQPRAVQAVGRYGFDEFIILLENTSPAEAKDYAENLRKAVEQAWFTSLRLQTTVSIGVSSYPQNAESLEDLIITVKNALFEAQRDGRNRVHAFPKAWYVREPAAEVERNCTSLER